MSLETTIYLPPLSEPIQTGNAMLDNLENLNDSKPVASVSDIDPLQDMIVVIIWSAMLTYAIASNLLVILGVLHSDQLRKSTSYWFIISLATCDLLMGLISLSHIVPATALHAKYVQVYSYRNYVAIFAYDVFWYTGVVKLGVMALNRLASIAYPMEYKQIFNRNRTRLIIAFTYFCGLMVSIPTLFPCCHTLYDHTMWVTMYIEIDTWCQSQTRAFTGSATDPRYSFVDLSVNVITVVLMVFSYSIIIWRVHSNQRALAKYNDAKKASGNQGKGTSAIASPDSVQTNPNIPTTMRRDKSKKCDNDYQKNHLQSPQRGQQCVVSEDCSSASAYSASQQKASLRESRVTLASPLATKWLYFAMTSLYFVNNSVNPTLYMIFNTALRREAKLVALSVVPRPVANAIGIQVRRASTFIRSRAWPSDREAAPTAPAVLQPPKRYGSRTREQSSSDTAAGGVPLLQSQRRESAARQGESAVEGAPAGQSFVVTGVRLSANKVPIAVAASENTTSGVESALTQQSNSATSGQFTINTGSLLHDNPSQQQKVIAAISTSEGHRQEKTNGSGATVLVLKKAASDAVNKNKRMTKIVITSAEGSSCADSSDDDQYNFS